MQFALLGSLTVIDDDGDRVAPAGPRLRVLLAALLLHANTPVSADALAEIVWDGSPPPAAVDTLRSYVKRLRRTLGAAGGARIETHDPGYVLRLGGEELDVLLFETYCRDAGTAIRAATWAEASAAAARALDLWRGEPLLDVPSQLLRSEFSPRLEQWMTQAHEDCIEAELQLGLHDRLVPQLRDLTARYPFRERFHAQLVLALARSGRRAEALEAYQQARRVLVEHLGIEPGSELRDLHGRVLAGELGSVAVPVAQVELRQLPAAVRHFTGRQTELDFLTGLPTATGGSGGAVVIAVVDGMAGVGKTALAVHAAHRLAGQFPDGQLFIDLHGYSADRPPRSSADVLGTLLGALGVPSRQIPRDPDLRVGLYRQRLAGTRTLIVLDNAADEAQVRPLLPGDAGCMALVTSRRRLKGLDDAHVLALDVLSEPEACSLLGAVAGPGRAATGDPGSAEVVALCGRLPLALRIAATILRHRPAWSIEYLGGLLRDGHDRIGALSDGERELGAVLRLSYAGLGEAQQQLFRRLGLMPGPDTDDYAAAALIDSLRATAARLLEELVDHNLLVQQTAGRYQMHDLVRLYARELADGESSRDREHALGRLIDYYVYCANRAEALITLYPLAQMAATAPADVHVPADSEAAWAWLRAERPNLVAALHRIADNDSEQRRSVGLSTGLSTLLRVDGPWSTAIDVHTAAAAAARDLGDDVSRAHTLLNLADARAGVYDYPGAEHDLAEAVKLYRVLDERRGLATALALSGEVRRMSGDCVGAAEDLEEAAKLYRDLGERRGLATALALSGEVRRMSGDSVGAAHDLEESVELYRALGERRGEAGALNWLGAMQALAGDHESAVGHLQEALRLYQALGERRGQANALTQLGAAWLLAGEKSSVERVLSDALRIYRDMGDRRGQSNALVLLGEAQRLGAGHPIAGSDNRPRLPALYPEGLHMTRETRRARRAAAATVAAPDQPNRTEELLRRHLATSAADRTFTRLIFTES